MKYMVPFVDMPRQWSRLGARMMQEIERVLSRGDLILRDDLRAFEERFARFVGTRYAVGVNSGFDALHLAVRACGLRPGDEVITVAHTFIATIAAFVHVGATPVLVDVADDFNMNVEAIEAAITPRTRAIIPVHLNGRMCDMTRILEIANRRGLLVIEDAAQALGATCDGRRAGSCGIAGCFSLYPFKMLGAYGDGGVVTTNDERIARTIRWLRDHGRDREVEEYRMYGFNCRLDNLQAAVLLVKLDFIEQWIRRRREIAKRYRHNLQDIPDLALPHFPDPRFEDVYQNYVIRTKRRDDLARYLEERGVETMISWAKPLHHHEALGLRRWNLPVTEQISREVLSLPMYPELEDEQVDYVCAAVREFFRSAS